MSLISKKSAGILIVIAGVCWGIIGIFSRTLSASGFNSIQITEIRSFVTALGLFLYLLLFRRWMLKIKWKDIWIFFCTGIFSIAFFNICYFITINLTTLSIAAILLYTAPCFVILLSFLIFKEPVTIEKAAGLFLAMLGCAFTTGVFSKGQLNITYFGLFTGIASGFCYGLYSIFGKIALRKYDSLTTTFYTFLFASAGLLPLSSPSSIVRLLQSDSSIFISVLFLGLLCTMTPFLLYTKGLSQIESGRASVMAFAEPLTATILGIVMYHEKMTFSNLLGILLIFCSLIITNRKAENH